MVKFINLTRVTKVDLFPNVELCSRVLNIKIYTEVQDQARVAGSQVDVKKLVIRQPNKKK